MHKNELKRNEELGALLSELDPQQELTSWSRVEELVAQAPPVRVSLWQHLTQGRPQRVLRHSVAMLIVLLIGTGVLAVMPAHSDYVGTLALTQLPSGWEPGSATFEQVKHDARAQFNAMGIPQSEMFMVVGERAGRDELAFALVGLNTEQAQEYLDGLAGVYPALAPYPATLEDITRQQFENRLAQVAYHVGLSSKEVRSNDTQLGRTILTALDNSGFGDVANVEIRREADGRIIIEIETELEVPVRGISQEDLVESGMSRELLGEANFNDLLSEINNSN